jgi:hypothetical protein
VPDGPILGRNAEGALAVVRRAEPGQLYKHHLERLAWMDELVANHGVHRALCAIVYWKPDDHEDGKPRPLARDRVEAAKCVVMLDLAILNAEAAAGIYKKPIDVLAKELRYEALSGEVRAVIIAAWRSGGMLPPAAIEEMVPLSLAESQ